MSVQQESGQVATDEVIQYEVEGGVATIWLNRPHVKNCINWTLLMGLGEMLDRAEEDEDVRVVVIRGRGNTFCAGADLNMLDSEFLGTTNASVKIAQVSAETFGRAFNLSKPTVAVVEGYAVAGGFELFISCDFAVVADAIARLPEREKLVVALYYYENLTLREIGEVLGVTESRISQLHTKAVLRLRSRLIETE